MGAGPTVGTIVAFRGERGSYNHAASVIDCLIIVAFRGERGSYNTYAALAISESDCSLPG